MVTEAPERSGALITARLANEYGRDVFALPGSLDNPASRGCLNLISQGAQLILDESTLIQALGQLPQLDTPPSVTFDQTPTPTPEELSPSMQQVLGGNFCGTHQTGSAGAAAPSIHRGNSEYPDAAGIDGGDHPIYRGCNTSVALNPNHVILIT